MFTPSTHHAGRIFENDRRSVHIITGQQVIHEGVRLISATPPVKATFYDWACEPAEPIVPVPRATAVGVGNVAVFLSMPAECITSR